MNFKEKRPLYLMEEIADILRSENGCKWDKEQTSRSLRPYLIEEAYEVYDAIENNKPEEIKEELGDLLYQIYAHAQIAKENKLFSIDDVANGIIDKLIRRHPHVFGDEKVENAEEVIHKWELIKKREKSGRKSILEGVPLHLPSILKAYRIQQKVSRIGFDWDNVSDAVEKIYEEIGELKEAAARESHDDILDEAGDILFSIINVLRIMKINPDEALNRTINKFVKRFKYIEKRVNEKKKDMNDMSLDELDAIWDESKKIVKSL